MSWLFVKFFNLHQETRLIRGLIFLAHRFRADELFGLFSTAPETLARRFCRRYGPALAIILCRHKQKCAKHELRNGYSSRVDRKVFRIKKENEKN